jgi:PilZ domain
MTSERRQSIRTRCLFSGQAVLSEKTSAISCMVKDMSDSGARIAFGGSTLLPRSFDLSVERKNMRRNVTIVWRRQDMAGVIFG